MSKWRKKPVVVEAVQFDPHVQPWPEGVIPWGNDEVRPRDMSWGYIQTLEGKMHVIAGDWIITGVKGEKYPCKPDIFEATYEAVQFTASGVEVEPLDWDKAKAHLDFYEKAYRELGGVGGFGLGITIMPLLDRYARGERTKWLYDDIMEVE